MLKHLIIQLSDDSVSYCHWQQRKDSKKLIPLEILKKAVLYAMKENLMVQFAYPEWALPDEYYEVIDSVDHVNIRPLGISSDEDMAVCSIDDLTELPIFNGVLNIHTSFEKLIFSESLLTKLITRYDRLNLVIDNVSDFNDSHIDDYSNLLSNMVEVVVNEMTNGRYPQVNILTDRIVLKSMNNCGAGVESISICPDGNFYLCPGFYMENIESMGNLESTLQLRNKHLYTLNYAPICSHCDAFHCKRCIKLNKQLTREVNTPSHQQCLMSNIERNASQKLLVELQEKVGILKNVKIPKINYLDPFENRKEWEE